MWDWISHKKKEPATSYTFVQFFGDGFHPFGFVLASQPFRHAPGVEGKDLEVGHAVSLLGVARPPLLEVDEVDGHQVAADNQDEGGEEQEQALVPEAGAAGTPGKRIRNITLSTHYCTTSVRK